jgi:hypothetical protein
MGYQGTGPVLTGTLSRGVRDTGEKMERAPRRTENGRKFRKLAPRDAKQVGKDDRTQEPDKTRGRGTPGTVESVTGTKLTQHRRDDTGS